MKVINKCFLFLFYILLVNCEFVNRVDNEINKESEGMSEDQYRSLMNRYYEPVLSYYRDSLIEINDTIKYSFYHRDLLFKGRFLSKNIWDPIEVFDKENNKRVTIDTHTSGNWIEPKQFIYWDEEGDPINDSSFYQAMKYVDSNTLKFKYEPISRAGDCYLIVSSFSLYNYEPHGGDSLVIDLKASNYDVEIPLTPNLLRKGGYFTGVIIERRPETGAVKRIGVFDHPKFNDVGNNNKTK